MANDTVDISEYEHLWTGERDHYILFTMRYHGRVELFIYNTSKKRVFLTKSPQHDALVIRKMLEHGVPIVDDYLLRQETSR